jgi:hypothetical protein
MRAMGVNEGSEGEGGMLETDDVKIDVLEAALAILRLKRSAEDVGT